jgi:hypothetical protein
VQTSEKWAKGVLTGMPIYVRQTLRKGNAVGAMIGFGYLRKQPYARSVNLLTSIKINILWLALIE